MQVKLRNIKTGEVAVAYFPLENPEAFKFEDMSVVDLVRPYEQWFEESDIRCAPLIYGIKPDKLPGKGAKDSSKELHLFLKMWDREVGCKTFKDGYWKTLYPRGWISLINITGDWEKACEIWEDALETGVELNDYKALGEYHLEKYQEEFDQCGDFELGSFFSACIHDEGFLNVEEYGRRVANNPANGYWASDLECWVDCSGSDSWKYWIEYGE